MNRRCQFSVTILLSVIYYVHSQDSVRWCVISDAENTKCWAMADALKGAGVTPEMECVRGANAAECMEKISGGEAHLITLDGGDIYHAGSVFGMKPVVGEQYDYGSYYYAVAVIRTTDAGQITLQNMKGRKSCHTGVRKTSGWNVPVGYLINSGVLTVEDCQGDVKAAAGFFSESCAPGALDRDYRGDANPTNLCALCAGTSTDNCARNSHEPYYNYDGAFRCLVEGGGEVAFVKHSTVMDVLNGGADWASGLTTGDYRLLCKDGTTRTVDRYQECNLAKVAGHGVMTSGVATSDDVKMYQKLLSDAKEKFGSDGLSGFRLFDSSDPSYGVNQKDLLFKDSTVGLYNVDTSYLGYLGADYIKTLQGLNQCKAGSVRWCTVGGAETTKCRAMKAAFQAAKLPKNISCYEANDHVECMQLIKDGTADVVTLDGGDAHKAGRDYGLVPVAGEQYSTDLDATSYYAVIVVKKSSTFSINDLKGKKSCHTGIMKTSGWNMPVGYLIETGKITPGQGCDVAKQVGGFFSASCVPGAQSSKYDPRGENPDNLCALCKGNGGDKCARSDSEPYYSYHGAFRCLAEGAGDVAFVKHTTVEENTGGRNTESWAAGLNMADYELLCRDGTRKPVGEWKSCSLARVPSHAVMTNKDTNSVADLWDLLSQAQARFGQSSTEFKMFDSSNYEGSNLLFKDSTIALVAAGSKDTYQAWLGDDYVKAMAALTCEGKKTSAGERAGVNPGVLVLALVAALRCLYQ